MEDFKFYEVGGKIRDELLGLTNKDVDYVAVPRGYLLDVVILMELLLLYIQQRTCLGN